MPRRQFFFATACLAGLLSAGRAIAAETYTLAAPLKMGEVTRVKVSMKVGGELFLQSDGKPNAKQRPLPMSVEANLEYDEKVTQVPAEPGGFVSAYRFYQRADAKIRLEKGGETPNLGESRRLVAVQAGRQAIILVAPHGPLMREELDLIDIPGNSLLLSGLLPSEAVKIGDHWKHPDELMARLLGLDVVSLADAESTLREVTDGVAKLEMAGTAQGAVGGVTAQLEFKAKYEVKVQSGRIVYFAMLIKDKRPPGQVNPGLDVVAKIVMELSPLEKCDELDADRLTILPEIDAPEATQLIFQPVGANYELPYERRWYVTASDRDLAILRLMDRGELVAQCNISPLVAASKSADGHLTLEQYQEHVKAALGERFGRYVAASQFERAGQQGMVFRVVAQGEQAALPLRWVYYLVTGPHGERVSLAFTLEEKLVAQFGSADTDLVGALRLIEPSAAEPRPAALHATREVTPPAARP
jgi:hypothetical protein